MFSDINDFIADLDRRGLLRRIRERVSPDLEIAAVDLPVGHAWR